LSGILQWKHNAGQLDEEKFKMVNEHSLAGPDEDLTNNNRAKINFSKLYPSKKGLSISFQEFS
jgi:hypothetical protein